MKKMKQFLSIMLLFLCGAVYAQQMNIPVDKGVRIGKLENGLTYYIRHNELPEHRADFYIAQKVGSILEEDNQRGLAHFLEHMCFNGTTHFPGDKLLRYLESHGVKFGTNVNAATGIDQTIYNISNVPTDHGIGLQDSCLLILHDWASDLLLEGTEIDKERGVIHEEWRSSMGAAMRIYEKTLPVLYPGSKYGYRLPIGTMDVVDNFPHQVLRDYYHTWYRPDQQGVIVVGDVDVDRIEAKIKELFGSIKMPENPKERVYEPVPDNEDAIYAMATDKEQANTVIYMMYKTDAFPTEQKTNLMYLVENYIESLIGMMINERFEDLSQKADAPFIAAQFDYSDYLLAKTKSALSFIGVPKPGMEKETMAALEREALRIRLHGFTAGEYDRARQEYLSQLEQQYTNRDKMKNVQFVDQYVANFTDNEPIPSLEDEYKLMNQLAPSIPLDAINQAMKQLIPEGDKNLAVLIMGQEKEGVSLPSESELRSIVNAVRVEKIEALVDNTIHEPIMATLPKAGKIVKEDEDKEMGTKIWTLSNGVKVISLKTDYREDQIIMSGYSHGGGTNRYNDSELANIKLLNGAVNASGLGSFTRNQLTKALSGIQVSVSPSIGSNKEVIQGNCVPKDMETMFQLTYLTFTAPLRDDEAYAAMINRQRTTLESYDADPMNAFTDALRNNLYANHPRAKRVMIEDLDKANYERMLAMYKECMSNAGDFVFIFVGNFDEAKLRDCCETYLASLPSTGKIEKAVDRGMRFASKTVNEQFSRKMENAQTYVGIFQTGSVDYNLQNIVNMDYVAQVLTMIYIEKIREEMGATYSVGSVGNVVFDTKEFVLQTALPIKPETKDEVVKVINSSLENLGKNGIDTKYFDKVKEYLVKSYQDNQKQNTYWSGIIESKEFEGLNYKKDYMNILNSTTPAMVQKFINDVILKQNRIEVVMVPAE